MGVSLKSLDMLIKYLVAFLPHIHRKPILFIPKTIDEAIIQEKYLNGVKQKKQAIMHKKVEPREKQRKKKNKKKWNEKKIVVAEKEETHATQ